MNHQILQKRIHKELKDLEKDPRPGITCYPKEDNITELEAYINGPPESPYEQGLFKLSILIPDRYPFEPPQIKFLTRIYHPNIDEGGRICADILKTGEKGGWNPAINLATALLSLRQLIATPNPDDPLEIDIAQEYKLDYPTFELKAKEFTKQYASEQDVLNDNDNDEKDIAIDKKQASQVIEETIDIDEQQHIEKPKTSLSLSKKKVSQSQSTASQSSDKSDDVKKSSKAGRIGLSRSTVKSPKSESPKPVKKVEAPKPIERVKSPNPIKNVESPKPIKKVKSPKPVKKVEPEEDKIEEIETVVVTKSKNPLKRRTSKTKPLVEKKDDELEKKKPLILEEKADTSKAISVEKNNHASKSKKDTVKTLKRRTTKLDEEKCPARNKPTQSSNDDRVSSKDNGVICTSESSDSSQMSRQQTINKNDQEHNISLLPKKEKLNSIYTTETIEDISCITVDDNDIASSAIDIINNAMLLSKDQDKQFKNQHIIELSDDDEEDVDMERPIYHSLSHKKRPLKNNKISLSRKRRS